MRIGGAALKQGILYFWAAWVTVVLMSNLTDAVKAMGLLPPGWRFASGNFSMVAEAVGGPLWLAALLFAGVLLWQGAAVWWLWEAARDYRFRGEADLRSLYTAFGLCLALWGAFALADELFLTYTVQAVHLRLFTAQAISLMMIVLLPEPEAA